MVPMGTKSISAIIWFVILLPIGDFTAHSHDGGLDSYGCHDHPQRHDYHCHWGRFRGTTFRSKSEMLRNFPSDEPATRQSIPQFNVIRVVDADTLVLDNRETVRLIGVDTPDFGDANRPAEHYGKEAFAFTRMMVEGKPVRLELDPANARTGHKDRYQRTLVYMFLQDGTFVNREIIRQGYGTVNLRSPFKYQGEFRRTQQEARGQGKGLWERLAMPRAQSRDDKKTAGSSYKNLTRPPLFVLGIYRTRRPTYVYSQPGEYAKIIFELEKGTTVNVVDIQGDWLMIQSKHGKTPGYIKKSVLIP